MFWRFGFANASAIDALLDRDDVVLEAILDEDELLQECKAQNTRLIDYFQRADVLSRLLGYVAGRIEAEGAGRFKYPYVATEVLCSEIWSIVETCVSRADELLVPFWETVLDRPPDEMRTQIAMAAHFTKINSTFLSKKPQEMWAFMKAQPNMVERILVHLETEPFLDLLVRILHDPVVPDIADWFASERLIPRLVGLLSPAHRPDMHAVVAELVSRVVSMAAPSPGGAGLGETGAPVGPSSNHFARELATRENVSALIGYILYDYAPLPASAASEPSASDGVSVVVGEGGKALLPDSDAVRPSIQSAASSVVHAIAVVVELIRKNNSDYFEPYLFHTLRNRLIHVQQQHAGQPDDLARAAMEQAMQEMVDKMGVVHLGPVLQVVCERVHEFQAYLAKPRSSLGSVSTTVGSIAPLTAERYRICELYAEILHCSNMALLNRPSEMNALYDAQGRLAGGLAALEDLARVIAMGATGGGEGDGAGTSEDELEPAQELPVHGERRIVLDEEDEDEEMSSGEDGTPGSSDDDEVMDEIAIDDEPSLPVSEPPRDVQEAETPPLTSPIPIPASAVGTLMRTDSDQSSPSSRPRSSHSRRSMRRSLRRSSLFTEVQLQPGERLKQTFLAAGVLPTMLDLFFEFPWNNFLHSVIYDLVHQILTGRVDKGSNRDLILALFKDARLMHRIVEGQARNDAESAKPKGARLGYMGHLTLMSEDVISALEHYPADLRAVIAPYAPVPAWEEYVHGRYHETKKKDTALLGGGKPVIAPGQRGVAVARWKADDNEAAAAAAAAMDGGGELTKSVGGHPTRAQTADFGPAEVDDDEDDEDDDDTSPQFARYLAQEMQATHHFESGSGSDASDDDDDEGGGWLARSTFDLGPPPARHERRATEPTMFDDTFGATSSAALADSYDDPFSADDDDAFGPFADSAAASGTDPFTFSPTISDDLEDAAGFDAFGTEFGEFHAATGAPSGDGETTPTAESWSFTSGSSSGLTDSAEDFGLGSENQAQEEKMKEGSRTAATRETK